ncbi:MAG: hypothetical protein KH295_06680 [Clostridiaceae bacterium]|nr:hypothetical protein [Clostridiaceae bacterium]
MADRKKRIGIIVGIVVVVLLLCALYWQVNRFKLAPSLYEDAEVMQGVTVQVETDEESNKITYVLQNHTTEEVDYDGIPALEYRDGQSWQEVLTKLGNRRFDGGRTAIGYFIAPMGTVSGEVDLESLPRLKDGTYRLVFPGVWENDPVICSEPFQWGTQITENTTAY